MCPVLVKDTVPIRAERVASGHRTEVVIGLSYFYGTRYMHHHARST